MPILLVNRLKREDWDI